MARHRNDATSAGLASRVEIGNTQGVSAFDELRDRFGHLGDTPCQHIVEIVTEYLEGALPSRAHKRFERHLRRCPACAIYLDQVRLTSDALGHVHPDPPTGPARDALLQAFRDFSSS